MGDNRKIGILGGTFNPIHFGHLLLAENAYTQFQLDEVWIMPNKHPAYRSISSNISEEHRCNMISLAIQDNPHFTLSTVELDREGTTYTVDTLRDLKKNAPEDDYYFILGADSLFHFESWRKPEEILKYCKLVAAPRIQQSEAAIEKQIDYLAEKYGATILLLDTPNVDISSHEIRKRIRNGVTIKYLLPANVEAYIKNHRLYQ